MIQVSCPDGWRLWVTHSRLQCGIIADKAARLFGYADGAHYQLCDRENRLLTRGEDVDDGASYVLVAASGRDWDRTSDLPRVKRALSR